MSSITIQNILNDNGLGNRQDRWLALEKANAGKSLELTAEQAAFLEKLNPCSRERHVESAVPGAVLVVPAPYSAFGPLVHPAITISFQSGGDPSRKSLTTDLRATSKPFLKAAPRPSVDLRFLREL